MPNFGRQISHFLKYNNAAIVIIAVILLFGGAVFASEPGRDAVGKKQTAIQGVDNKLLLAADLDKHKFDFKIEKIEGDEKYYYVNFTFLDIAVVNSAWQYQMREGAIKVSKNIPEDLGNYLSGELKDIQEKRLKELKEAKDEAIKKGEEKRIQVTEYTGLIGKTLNLAGNILPNYEPVKKVELPTPATDPALTAQIERNIDGGSGSDNLTQVYLNYVAEHNGGQANPPAESGNTSGPADSVNPPAAGDNAGSDGANAGGGSSGSAGIGADTPGAGAGGNTGGSTDSQTQEVQVINLPQNNTE
ncbi:MAG: hypothetical protein WCW77_01190 [Patescibacteria group bacterium]|jgi:hypothetical protein